jgi:arylsulfatase A-like enzyme
MPRQRPHILLTIADDQRHDMLGRLGHPRLRTPALDRLAERGTCFSHAFHLGSNHPTVCGPSRAMLHTGRPLFRIPHEIKGGDDWTAGGPDEAPDRVPLLGEQLRRAGYHTHGVGKWHNGADAYARSFSSGGAIFFGGMSSHFAVPIHDFDPNGRYDTPPHTTERHSTELFTDAALAFLRDYDGDEPFFLYVAYTAPHDPRQTLPEWHARYRAEDVTPPPNFLPQHPFDNGELHIRDEQLAAFPRTEGEVRRHIAEYEAITAHLDDAIGRLHAALDEAGHADDTLVIHTADHGLSVGRHGLMGKQNLYDHSVRVPLLMAGPGVEAGRTDDRLCYQHDLNPTLLAAAGLDPPGPPFFRNLCESSGYDEVFCCYRLPQRMVRDHRHKLIEYRVEGQPPRTQLFDLTDDPHEIRDLAGRPESGVTIERLRERLADWQRRVDDPVLAAHADKFGTPR